NEAPVFTSLPAGITDEYLTDVDGPCPSAIIFDTDLPTGNCSSSQFMGIGADGNAYFYNFDGPCAIDDCNSFTISVISTVLVDDGCTKLFELEWTEQDACGNQDVFVQSIGFYDLATPEWTSANPIIVDADCATVDVAAIKAANAPTATDNCTATVTEGATTTIAGNCTGNYTLVVAYTVEDASGNTNPTTAELRINVTDTNAPTFTASPSDLTMECNGSGNTAGLNAWLSSNGTTGAASDDCGTVSWSYQLAGSVAGACNGTGSWTYWFIATDDCGNISSESATVTIEDTTDPVVTCP